MEPTKTPAPGNKSHGDYLSINGFLEKTTTALTNAQLPDIQPLLAARGYAAADLAGKLAEAEALRGLNEKQQAEHGEQYEATKTYNDSRARLHEDYMDHLRLARVVFKADASAQAALGLNGKRAASQSGYVAHGLQFYNNALDRDAYVTALAAKGITGADLTAGQAAFKNLQTLTAAQQKETGEAIQATRKCDDAYDALQEWMSDFYETAKVALRKSPELMGQLGV